MLAMAAVQLKILNSIISAYPVFMVHGLRSSERATNVLFHDMSVEEHSFVSYVNSQIAVIIRVWLALF